MGIYVRSDLQFHRRTDLDLSKVLAVIVCQI